MTVAAAFDASVEFLDSLYHLPVLRARQVGLRRVQRLLHEVGNPQQNFRSVHVAGSTGKGSTTTMIGRSLQAAGFRTGYFLSPHLRVIRERITVGDREITAEDWVSCWERVRPVVEAMRDGNLPRYDLGRPTYFEVVFALMALHFAASRVEWAAVETGLGGRYDATNTLESDVAVVTNVSLEHTRVLGTTVAEIAAEKAAIIKTGCHAVTAAEHPDALDVVRGRARDVGAPLLEVPRDVSVAVSAETIDGQEIVLHSAGHDLPLRLPLAGRYQRANAAAAYAAMLSLSSRGVDISDGDYTRALAHLTIPGRLEILSRDPLVVLDAAHSVAGAMELSRAIDALLPGRAVVLLFAAMSDKDLATMAGMLGPRASAVIVTESPGTERAAPVERLVEAFTPYSEQVIPVTRADRALAVALDKVPSDGALVICGSMYLVGHIRSTLRAEVAPR